MKSYTNIEQSNKLVEILSPESADMIYCYTKKEDKLVYPIPIYLTGTLTNTFKYLYCWSLSALLNAIPSSTLDSSDSHHYRIRCNERYSEWYDNPIDACYNMVLKLHELNIL